MICAKKVTKLPPLTVPWCLNVQGADDKLGQTLWQHLKVPKCEIFDRSDFHDFYPIKSLWEDDFAVKIKCLKKIFRGSFGATKFLTRMLSLILRRDFF